MRTSFGFTLVEMLIAIAITGVLALVALSAYQDYTTRTRLSEAIITASAAKATISEFYMSARRMPKNKNEAGISINSKSSELIKELKFSGNGTLGVLTIEVNSDAITNITDTSNKIEIRAKGNIEGIIWECAPAKVDSIDRRFLPPNCR